jgi:hypothetical protein
VATYYNYISKEKKLNRVFRLTVQEEDARGFPTNSATVIENPCTIKFSVNRTLFADINSLDIEIYNLAPNTYNRLFYDYFRIEERRRTVVLEAGYEGQELSIIFIGDVWNCYTSRVGSDMVTKMHALVGLKSLQMQIDLTLSGIDRNKVLRTAANAMNMDIEIYSGENTKFNRPVSMTGNAYGVIQKYTDGDVFIDNNVIKVLKNQDYIKGGALLINDESGMLGAPSREDALLTVKLMFEPRIMIGQIVEIQSRIMDVFNGQYKVYGIKHEGTISDAIGGTCTTTLQMLVGSQPYGRFNAKSKQ